MNAQEPGERGIYAGAEVLFCAECPSCLATDDLGARLVHHSPDFHTFVPGNALAVIQDSEAS